MKIISSFKIIALFVYLYCIPSFVNAATPYDVSAPVSTHAALRNSDQKQDETNIWKSNATEDTAYAQSIAGTAKDDDFDTLTYSKLSGPAWLNVASDGALSGTPGAGDVGENAWTVQVDDGNGGTDTATLNITVGANGKAPSTGLGCSNLGNPNRYVKSSRGDLFLFGLLSSVLLVWSRFEVRT